MIKITHQPKDKEKRLTVRCDNMSTKVNCEVKIGSLSWNSGRYLETGVVSQSTFPSATSSPIAVAVNAFVTDAMCDTVYKEGDIFWRKKKNTVRTKLSLSSI